MKALSRLQGSIIVQAAADDNVVAKFNERARMFIAAGALIAVAITSGNAHAQSNEVLTPSNCAMVGAVVGGTAAQATSDKGVNKIIFGALGALGGGALGNYLCAPKAPRSMDSSYQRAEGYGGFAGAAGNVERTAPKMALSISERERLDAMSFQALGAKVEWKRALWQVSAAEQAGNRMARNTALESESVNRRDFEVKRAVFATAVARFNAGSDQMEPRAVGRYLEISASILELDTESKTSYEMLSAKDKFLQDRSPAYAQEADRSVRAHNKTS